MSAHLYRLRWRLSRAVVRVAHALLDLAEAIAPEDIKAQL